MNVGALKNGANRYHHFCLKGETMSNFVKQSSALLTALFLLILGLTLSGCGGGGGSNGASAEVVSGTAAVGAPLSGQVSLKDSSTPAKQKSTRIGNDGLFAIDVTGMKAPFILQASGTAADTEYKLLSFAEGTGTANINPLSDAIVMIAAGNNDDERDDIFESANQEHNSTIKNNLAQAVATLRNKLQPLLRQYNSENSNPITSPYLVNHRDMDEMFDKVKIVVHDGILLITNKQNSTVIFSGEIHDIAHGLFDSSALPAAIAAPAAPVSLSAVGGAGQVTLSWAPVSTATSYNVYYATTAGVTRITGTKISSVSSPYVQTGLTAGTSYYFVVTALNSSGESAASNQASAVTAATPPAPTVPAAPTGVNAGGGTGQLTISWNAVSSATSYNVYYGTFSGVTSANGTKIAAVASPAVLIGLTAGTTYYCIVTAVNSVGESSASVQVAAATLPATPLPTAPGAPAGVSAVGGANQATISWPTVSGATAYNIYYATTSGVTKASGTKIANAMSPYTWTGLAAGTTYYFVVTALNSAGESPASAQTSVATNAPPAQTCGTCHAIPPALGRHSIHAGAGYDCSTCHGAGYSKTAVTAATHMNGVKNVTLGVWNATTRTCATFCHGSRAW